MADFEPKPWFWPLAKPRWPRPVYARETAGVTFGPRIVHRDHKTARGKWGCGGGFPHIERGPQAVVSTARGRATTAVRPNGPGPWWWWLAPWWKPRHGACTGTRLVRVFGTVPPAGTSVPRWPLEDVELLRTASKTRCKTAHQATSGKVASKAGGSWNGPFGPFILAIL